MVAALRGRQLRIGITQREPAMPRRPVLAALAAGILALAGRAAIARGDPFRTLGRA
jgi:hypothetical protein